MLLFAGSEPRSTPAIDQPSSRAYGDLPIGFQPNRGQSDGAVRFLSTGAGYGLFLTNRRAVLDLGGSAISMSLVGASPSPQDHRSRSTPRPGQLPRRAEISLGDLGPDLLGRSLRRGLARDRDRASTGTSGGSSTTFELAPGADPTAIGLRFAGQRRFASTGPAG